MHSKNNVNIKGIVKGKTINIRVQDDKTVIKFKGNLVPEIRKIVKRFDITKEDLGYDL